MRPSTSTKATVFLHDGTGMTEPLSLHLHSNLLRLLRTFAAVQARARGEVVIPVGEEDPLFASLDNMPPADVELCLIGAVGKVMKKYKQSVAAFWGDVEDALADDLNPVNTLCTKTGDELMIVTAEEADWLRAERKRVGTGPLSELRRKGA